MQALVGTDEVESVDRTMLIPVSIFWWEKCCHLFLCPRQVPPGLSVLLHKLKFYLHSILLLETFIVVLLDLSTIVCLWWILINFLLCYCCSAFTLCNDLCFLSSNKLKGPLDITVFLSLRMLLCCCCRYPWICLWISKRGPLVCMCIISVMTCKFPNLCSISNTRLE
jgi:hypothetical protein